VLPRLSPLHCHCCRHNLPHASHTASASSLYISLTSQTLSAMAAFSVHAQYNMANSSPNASPPSAWLPLTGTSLPHKTNMRQTSAGGGVASPPEALAARGWPSSCRLGGRALARGVEWKASLHLHSQNRRSPTLTSYITLHASLLSNLSPLSNQQTSLQLSRAYKITLLTSLPPLLKNRLLCLSLSHLWRSMMIIPCVHVLIMQ